MLRFKFFFFRFLPCISELLLHKCLEWLGNHFKMTGCCSGGSALRRQLIEFISKASQLKRSRGRKVGRQREKFWRGKIIDHNHFPTWFFSVFEIQMSGKYFFSIWNAYGGGDAVIWKYWGLGLFFFHWVAAAAAKRLCRRARNVSSDPRVNRDPVVKRKSCVWSGQRLSYVLGFVQLPFTFLVSPQAYKEEEEEEKDLHAHSLSIMFGTETCSMSWRRTELFFFFFQLNGIFWDFHQSVPLSWNTNF